MNYQKLCKNPFNHNTSKTVKKPEKKHMNIHWRIINFHKYIIIKKMTKYKLLMCKKTQFLCSNTVQQKGLQSTDAEKFHVTAHVQPLMFRKKCYCNDM